MLEVAALLVFVAAMLSTGASRQDNINVTIAILGVVLLNATIGFFQEYRAEKATEALQKLVPSNAKVIRDGEVTIVAATDLVPGDVIVLEEGDSISADARLVRQYELSTNNIALTGESDAVRKTADPIIEEELATINMPNLVFMGTSVASGTGRAVVFATGLKTEFGRIYSLTAGVSEDKSPLMREIDSMARTVSVIALVCGVLLFFIALFVFKFGMVDGLLFALGVMVALVPEGMPATLSVALAVGVQRMAKAKALIKGLAGVETLGSTNVIATDKTGTLTKAEMTLKAVWADGDDFEVTGAGYAPDRRLRRRRHDAAQGRGAPAARAAPARHDVLQRRQGPRAQGRQRLARDRRPDRGLPSRRRAEGRVRPAGGTDRTTQDLRVAVRERAQAHERRARRGRRPIAYVKGAPSETLGRCTHVRLNGDVVAMTDERAGADRGARTTPCRARRCAYSPCASAACQTSSPTTRLTRSRPT